MKIKLLVLALVSSVGLASAQVQFSVGLKAGPNFSKLNVEQSPADNFKNRAGFHGGAFMLVKISKVGIQPEVLFSKQGSKFSFNTDNYSSNFDYVNIPVVVKLYTVAGINLQLGPQISFLAKSGGKTVQTVNGVSSAIDASKDLYKKSDFGAVFGVGWDLPFGLMVEGRYNLGLSKIQDNPDLDATKNQVIQVSLGYKLIKVGK
jgi:Outer membrane protein beta-barrel domain